MRFLFAIPHYFASDGIGYHGSTGPDPRQRQAALARCIGALHGLLAGPAVEADWGRRRLLPANPPRHHVDVVVVTTGGRHALHGLSVAQDFYLHREVDCPPLELGHAARGFLADRLGSYDWYGFLEDDLRLHDPWFFTKLGWFGEQAGEDKVLLPNRFEMSIAWPARKVYADGAVNPEQSGGWSNGHGPELINGQALGRRLTFRRAANPHAGCWFLTRRQMERLAEAPHFMDREASFIGPLESAATLALMRSFPIYKPGLDCADFLEIEHQDDRFMRVVAGLAPNRGA
ncbi:MAG TPA: calcium-binding protein [Alphaproteobacteria bacterium]|nr:calcium-binding protein [Alphaproteobacteria bacterium]